MRQKPTFTSDEHIIAKLARDYGLTVTNLSFLTVGEDSWCYLAEGDEGDLFVKLARGNLYPPSLIIPKLLRDVYGYRFVNPARPDRRGQLWGRLAEHDFVIYPYIEGDMVMGHGLAGEQWLEIGRMIAGLHRIRLDEEEKVALKREDFVPPRGREAKRVVEYASTVRSKGIAWELAHFIMSKESEIKTIIARAEELGEKLKQQQPELVLCHADPNQANILLADDGRPLLVDWDGVMLAPRERDLTFFTGNEQGAFMEGYDSMGAFRLNPGAIAYYKYEWVVQEIADDGSRIFFTELDGIEKEHALREFYKLFEDGDVVEAAYEAGEGLTREY